VERSQGVSDPFTVIATITDSATTSYLDSGSSGTVESTVYAYRVLGTNRQRRWPGERWGRRGDAADRADRTRRHRRQPDECGTGFTSHSASEIHVYRALASGGGFTDIATVDAGSHSYTDNDVLGGRTYLYKLVTNDGSNNSGPTNTAG